MIEKQDARILMPTSLTAENGAKYVLSGEFNETIEVSNPEFCGCGECSFCIDFPDTPEEHILKIPVSWTNMKDIYAKAVELFKEQKNRKEAKFMRTGKWYWSSDKENYCGDGAQSPLLAALEAVFDSPEDFEPKSFDTKDGTKRKWCVTTGEAKAWDYNNMEQHVFTPVESMLEMVAEEVLEASCKQAEDYDPSKNRLLRNSITEAVTLLLLKHEMPTFFNVGNTADIVLTADDIKFYGKLCGFEDQANEILGE